MDLTDKHVFVVEDDATNLAVVSAILRRHGAFVYHDRWGLNTLKQMQMIPHIDLILLDLMFPEGVSGYDVFDQIRENPKFNDIPIVAVTASDPDVELPKVQTRGFSGFLTKPLNHKTFAQDLGTILEGNPVWGADE